MSDQSLKRPEDRPGEAVQEKAVDTGRVDHEDFDLQPGEGRMSGARTGRSGGAHEDQGGPSSGSTPEGRSGT